MLPGCRLCCRVNTGRLCGLGLLRRLFSGDLILHGAVRHLAERTAQHAGREACGCVGVYPQDRAGRTIDQGDLDR